MAMKTIVQPHASAWGYFHVCRNPKLTHGANRASRGFESVDVGTRFALYAKSIA